MTNTDRTTTDVLEEVVDESSEDNITVGQLVYALHERGFGIALALFSIPLCPPIPIPGLATIFSMPLFIIAIQMIMGRTAPWMPDFIARKSINRKTLQNVIIKLAPYMRKIERFLRPRIMTGNPRGWEVGIGVMVLILCIPIALPIPFGNFIPAWGVFFMALGLLGRDGIAVIIGVFFGSLGIIQNIILGYLFFFKGSEYAYEVLGKLKDSVF